MDFRVQHLQLQTEAPEEVGCYHGTKGDGSMSHKRRNRALGYVVLELVRFTEFLFDRGIDPIPKQGENIPQQLRRLEATYPDEHTTYRAWEKMK